MMETEITILVNRKSDFDIVRQKVIDSNIQGKIIRIIED